MSSLPCTALRNVAVEPLPARSHLWSHVRPGDFIDGYAVTSALPLDQALATALAMPGWARRLLALRNTLMRPFGLRRAAPDAEGRLPFPITYRGGDDTAGEILLGFDDSHLNFRIALLREGERLHMATWVQRNNLLGRLYLAAVMPFHRLIVRDALARVAATR
ncbi:DUF2867 domain-containing protein [Pseudooceanicola nanhaiensis]|uniref:DUF2867 domain-containing protein n=1 Tax=Pseudooceanicola nanhaiensis TaxID=375761 RepID=UPI001CD54353|nr:DUF2867 domain-containing protein [Pseudooceanicola nanhaiensis]MCA0919637.1 DUF2867 domain-containing protein [Pseudooceanicola nanhaiensis]